jgi:phosphate acyltransferase
LIKIVVDLLGADKPQTELVLGAIRAISENKDLYVYLMGRKAELEDFLANVTYDESQLEIVDCTQEITNYDDPVDAYHDKTDSSLIKGLKMCRMNEDIGGFVTCGATGVVLISSILILGKLNATRPALSVVLNGRKDKPFCIVDCGANIDCKADRFVDFARLGVAYMKTLGIENPTVATLSNGIEAGKGSDVIKEAHELLEKCGFNFTGNIEGKEVLDGNADVVVCDGFAGNVLLKSIEGTAKVVFDDIRRAAAGASDTQNKLCLRLVSTKQIYNYLYQISSSFCSCQKLSSRFLYTASENGAFDSFCFVSSDKCFVAANSFPAASYFDKYLSSLELAPSSINVFNCGHRIAVNPFLPHMHSYSLRSES